jgi:hypothetical protein
MKKIVICNVLVGLKLIIFLPSNVIPCRLDVIIHILCVLILMFKWNIKGHLGFQDLG